MSKFILKRVFRVYFFLGASLLCRINLDNRILLVSCEDLLKTKFTISSSRPPFPPLEMNAFLFQLEFSSVETTGAFTSSSHPSYRFSCRQKCPIILPPDLRLNFLLKGTAYQKPQIACNRLIVSTSNHKKTC